MSLVSNLIGGISSSEFGNNSKILTNFDLNDNTFSNILEKKLENSNATESNNILDQLGIPAGMNIEPLDFDNIEQISEIKDTNSDFEHAKNNIKLNDSGKFFSTIIGNELGNKDNQSELFDFAKRQATNLYHQYSKDVITDVQEFVNDIKSFI